MNYKSGYNCVISDNARIGNNVEFGHNCIVEAGACIGDNSYVDSNTIIRMNAQIGRNAFVGANCIIGEYLMDFCLDKKEHQHKLTIGDDALIRSGSIIYAGSSIGNKFQTGHQVTIREDSTIGDHVSVGTLSDIQGNCRIGNYVRMHSNVHIGQLSEISDFVWIYPYVVLTNDPTPPSERFIGVKVKPFAIIATSSIIMPGLVIGQDSLVAAGAIVTKDVPDYAVVAGNPGKQISDVSRVKSKFTGEPVYPWREHFGVYMPWADSDFQTWYDSLDLAEKEKYGISSLNNNADNTAV